MFTKMFPELHVSDVEKAVEFFTDAIGLTVDFSFEDEGQLDFAVLKHGDMMLYLHHMLPDEESDHPKRMRLYFELPDIEGLRAELATKGYDVSEIQNQDYGARTCSLIGPDNYEICFQQWTKKQARSSTEFAYPSRDFRYRISYSSQSYQGNCLCLSISSTKPIAS